MDGMYNSQNHRDDWRVANSRREATLGAALDKAGISRQRINDSRLCQHYVKGVGNLTADQVVGEIREMDRYQNETAYPVIFGAMSYCHDRKCPKTVHAFQAKDRLSSLAKCYVNRGDDLSSIEVCGINACLLDREDLQPSEIITAEMNNYEQHPIKKALLQNNNRPVYIKQ